MNIFKKAHQHPEEDMQKGFEHELDELIDDDFDPSQYKSQSNELKNEKNKEALETLDEELKNLYTNYGEELFNYEDESSLINDTTPRGYTLVPSTVDDRPSKLIHTESGSNVIIETPDQENFGIYKQQEIEEKLKSEIPFSIATDYGEITDERKNLKAQLKIEKPRESEKIEYFNPLNDKSPKLSLRPTDLPRKSHLKLGDDLIDDLNRSSQKRVSSAGKPRINGSSSGGYKIPSNLKKKLRKNPRKDYAVKKYSIDKFKEKQEHHASDSRERLRKNLEKFKKNTIFRKGSESERSLNSLHSMN